MVWINPSLLLCGALTAVVATAPASSQVPTEIGLGTLKRFFNLTDAVSGFPGEVVDDVLRDVALVDGLLYVTGSPPLFASAADGVAGPQVYAIHPETAVVLGSFSVPGLTFAYGIDKDLEGRLIIGGGEGAVVYDTAGNLQSDIRGSNGLVGLPDTGPGDGPIITGPSLGFGQALSQYYGLAFDPSGDGGNGSLFVGDERFGDSIFEVRVRDGGTQREFENLGWTCAGLVIDPYTGNLWCSSSFPNEILELDRVDMSPTGITIAHLPEQSGGSFTQFGGLELLPGGDPTYPWSAAYDLISVSQQRSDWVAFHRLHQIPGVPGYAESVLAGSTGPSPIAPVATIPFTGGETLNWGMVDNGRSNLGAPAVHFINTGPDDAFVNGLTDVSFLGGPPVLPELVVLSFLSAPQASSGLFQSSIVGNPEAPPPAPTGVTTVTLPPIFPVFPGDVIRIQSVYFDSNADLLFPFAASNEIRFVAR